MVVGEQFWRKAVNPRPSGRDRTWSSNSITWIVWSSRRKVVISLRWVRWG